MAGFYGVYLAKQLSQRSQGIRTNQMGRGNKELRTLTVERLLAAFSVLIVVVEVWSVVGDIHSSRGGAVGSDWL